MTYGTHDEEKRLCPTCRMAISVWASRCRFCGEKVGRPKKEEERLTIEDLGGESSTTYTVSGNVQDAIEAFRAETLSQQERERRRKEAEQSQSFLGRLHRGPRQPEDEEPRGGGDFPELDQFHRELADSVSAPSSRATRQRRRGGPEALTRRILLLAALVAGLVLLYIGTDFAWARIQDYLDARRNANRVIYNNRAEIMLRSGAPLESVLEEALEAVRYTDTNENRAILQNVKTQVINEVETMLQTEPWDRQKQFRASELARKAAELDPQDQQFQRLETSARREYADYSLILTGVDSSAGTATFRLNNPFMTEETVEVHEGEQFLDRFVVSDVETDRVLLADQLYQTSRGTSRRLLAKRGLPITAWDR